MTVYVPHMPPAVQESYVDIFGHPRFARLVAGDRVVALKPVVPVSFGPAAPVVCEGTVVGTPNWTRAQVKWDADPEWADDKLLRFVERGEMALVSTDRRANVHQRDMGSRAAERQWATMVMEVRRKMDATPVELWSMAARTIQLLREADQMTGMEERLGKPGERNRLMLSAHMAAEEAKRAEGWATVRGAVARRAVNLAVKAFNASRHEYGMWL